MRRVALAILLLIGLAAAGLAWKLNDRPSLEGYAEYFATPSDAAGLSVTFLGVTTLLFDDGTTQLLTDGFFTRPGLRAVVFGRIEPDRERIAHWIERAGLRRLAAVLPVHSHYDHAMDAPEVARLTGARLLGSESTANIGRGWRLPEAQIRVVTPGEALEFGAFTLTALESRHIDFGYNAATLGRSVAEPLVPPVRATDYEEGVSYSVHLAHPLGRVLVQGSAGFVENRLAPYPADVVFLGTGGLSRKDADYREAYYREVVEAVGATRVIPVHWDDFTRPLEKPLEPLPSLVSDVPAVLDFLIERTRPPARLEMLRAGERVLLFPEPPPAVAPEADPLTPRLNE